jgi:hypothetical protein
MIPTRSKAKLSHILSYPIGAQEITEGLGNSPHVDNLSLSFRESPIWPASAFQKVLADRCPYRILSITYIPPSKPGYSGANSMVESGWYGERWELDVFPVPRVIRQAANRVLKEIGLPAVVRWLSDVDRAGIGRGHRRLELEFDPTPATLTPKDSRAT